MVVYPAMSNVLSQVQTFLNLTKSMKMVNHFQPKLLVSGWRDPQGILMINHNQPQFLVSGQSDC